MKYELVHADEVASVHGERVEVLVDVSDDGGLELVGNNNEPALLRRTVTTS